MERETNLCTPDLDLNSDLPVIGRLICESAALDHAATEVVVEVLAVTLLAALLKLYEVDAVVAIAGAGAGAGALAGAGFGGDDAEVSSHKLRGGGEVKIFTFPKGKSFASGGGFVYGTANGGQMIFF
ncbi:unnamed protein product [Timema podura]|uniref:Uncharacterized protein n=1 Tax=Timema podura TaxID=61482 RepID=A0ABN7NHD7_TIMPD|nr:unnamed protein product [Timema podura]